MVKSIVSVNCQAWKLLEELLESPSFYGIKTSRADSGAMIVDAGIEATGGFQAGRIITEICMGGCGKVEITCGEYGNLRLPSVFVFTDHPVIATLGSQYAGWQISEDGYFAIGSGPARALALKPKKIYQEIDYRDQSDKAIVVLETERYPPRRLVQTIARDCNINTENLALILTPTTSISGMVQISGRIVETGIHKLRLVGLDPNRILHAWGIAPIPPVHPKFEIAMARTNDAILYGGSAYYVVEYDDEKQLANIMEKAPSEASKDYGKPFVEILGKVDNDFYKVDPNLFAPAVIVINNVKTGKTLISGRVNVEIMAKSFGLNACSQA